MNDQTTPAPENVIQLGVIKKQSIRPPEPAEPVAAAVGADTDDDKLVPYEDGTLFRCSPKPDAKHGEFYVHDGSGQIVAATKNRNIANLFCEAVHLYILSARSQMAASPTPEVIPAMPADVAAALAKSQTPVKS